MNCGGHVYLVGAGPGPADLLTVRARELIARADVLAYDDLVHPTLLDHAAPHCELIAVGYRAGEHADRPPPLHPLVLERAAAGKMVVRLKSGDPLIFGRGGEEAEALVAAAIPFTFVPGITAALAAASVCNLPLTWRGRASEVRISTQGSILAPSGTACTWALYMPRHGIETFTSELSAKGWPADTPAAFVIAAAHRQQQCIRSSLGSLAQKVKEHPSELPGLVIIGEALRTVLPYSETKASLQGCRILVARAHTDPSRLVGQLEAEGADVWGAPWIRSRPSSCVSPLQKDRLLKHQFVDHNWILVASAAAFEGFISLLREINGDLRCLQGQTIISIGAAREALAAYLLKPGVHFRKRQILLKEWPHEHLTYARDGLILAAGDEGEELQLQLETIGVKAQVLRTADFQVQYPRLPLPRPDFIVAPHQKSLQMLFADAAYRDGLKEVKVVAFGRKVAELARSFGCQVVIEASLNQAEEVVPLLQTLWNQPLEGEARYGRKSEEGSADSLYGAR